MPNAMMAIYPYKHEGMWVFDDEKAGLDKEPFVEGADDIIDRALEQKGIRNGGEGFRLLFSAGEFPRHDLVFRRIRQEGSGTWYRSDDFEMEGWLCPALLKYFDEAPDVIYTRFESKE